MKTFLHVLFFITVVHATNAQITSQVIKAGFGVDGELRANYFMGIAQSGNDDWFSNSAGSGQFVIDTTGAAALMAQYTADPNIRKIPFYRTMRVDPYTLMNNYLAIDAVFIRDYHGDDSTIFAAGNKNGMSPADWNCPVAQSIPDKNEILDMMVHVRRAGPNTTDSLWLFGGLSIENNVGNRYFDFEMYQTDIYYDRASRKFYGYGVDAGHTSWQFDGSGNITRPGDIVFSAEYANSTLTSIEARIWINKASLSMTPADFTWSGSFDGATASSQYGYAGIRPKTVGAFYTGLSSAANTWAGPFRLVKGDNSVVTTYAAAQYMEFSVNLSKLGLDPVTLLGSDNCGMPFRRVLVKSRASTSFTAELKDFVGPFDFFLAPRANVEADIPYHCGSMGVSELRVVNPVSTSVYTWSTPNGNFVGSTSGTVTSVNAPGTYILRQQLQSGCGTYATDTVVITYDASCTLLRQNLVSLQGNVNNKQANLNWSVTDTAIQQFEIQRSTDGLTFSSIARVTGSAVEKNYSAFDDLSKQFAPNVYYRLKFSSTDGQYGYSRIIKLNIAGSDSRPVNFSPNPVKDVLQLTINSPQDDRAEVLIYDLHGRVMRSIYAPVKKGTNSLPVSGFDKWQGGIYPVKIRIGANTFAERLVLIR